jgi:polysaccharide biosynthesis transport protein
VLANETKKNALVQENLYVVNGNADSDGLSQAFPKRFTALVPKLKASDYDYIIFDMPVISPASVTSHMARFMDITLLVVESEKTGRDIVEQANAWLTEVGASVGVVLNKTHQYVPRQLDHEFLSQK